MHMRENFPHFLNSSRFVPGTFSRAIDCFLEVWLRSVSVLIPKGVTHCHILRLLNVTDSFVSSSTAVSTWDPYRLHLAREDVWSLLRSKCPSLVPMDCTAQFGEVFQISVFDQITLQEKETIISSYIKVGFCEHCSRSVNTNCDIMINYISLRDVLASQLMPSEWPSLLENNHQNTNIKCDICRNPATLLESQFELSSVLFVEFNPGMLGTNLMFAQQISVLSTIYVLVQLSDTKVIIFHVRLTISHIVLFMMICALMPLFLKV